MQPAENSRSAVAPGTRLGRYEVIAEIASGGMATVYLGRALGAAGFQRLVAIKCLHPHVARDEEFVVMFMDEARLAARIRHPNVVPTLDLENGADGLFLVMEYVEGDGLLSLLRAATRDKERMPQPVALRIVLDVLHGLHAAHELTGDRGEPLRIVHRDVSPHNVLVGLDGITRITDFGIARAEERIGATREGQVKGKLAYMAPEQTSGTPVDRRADVFATGVVLWECLAGRRLFQGANDGEVLRHLLVTPIPRLREVVPEIPAALDEVCARALARDPNDRYATAAQLADALEEAGGAVGIGSARAVASFVRQLSWSKIEAMQQQVRALTGEFNSSVVRPATRPRLMSDPERTMRRDSIPNLAREVIEDLSAEAVREATKDGLPAAQVAVPGSVAPSNPAAPAANTAPYPAASAPPGAVASAPPAYGAVASAPPYGAAHASVAPRASGGNNRGIVIAALVVFLAVVTFSGLVIWRSTIAPHAPAPAPVAASQPAVIPTTPIVAPVVPPPAPSVAPPPSEPPSEPPPPAVAQSPNPPRPPRSGGSRSSGRTPGAGTPNNATTPPRPPPSGSGEPYNPEAM